MKFCGAFELELHGQMKVGEFCGLKYFISESVACDIKIHISYIKK